jgi:hypothetical protein
MRVDGDRIESAPVQPKPVAGRASRDVGSLLASINGVLTAFAGLYAATRSVFVTLIAGLAALILSFSILRKR